ncbi:MAG: IS66 family transposase [Elusimicrobia bacterium]|nr:IS66 family transposase [Elusimicrobiota bacterium]
MSIDFSTEKSVPFLRAAAQALQDENARLRTENAQLRARLGEQEAASNEENAALRHLLDRREQELFGRSSERRQPATKPQQPPRKPQKGHGPQAQPGIAYETVPHELPEDKRECPQCGGTLERLGDEAEESELITVVERFFVIQKHRRAKYRCRCNACVVTATGPQRLTPGGRYSPAFAVEVAVGKYADHLPLERQVAIMRRDGLQIRSQTLWDQLDALAKLLAPTYEAICQRALSAPVIACDETWWLLLDNGKTKENKTYQTWAVVSENLVAYRILDSRSRQAASALLGEFTGVVMADGYTVYRSLAEETQRFVVANCWAHVRRKFVECEKNFPDEAGHAIARIGDLYAIDREHPDDLAEARDKLSRPLIDDLFRWARSALDLTLPRGALAGALNYMLNLEPGLRKFLDDPRIPIDNNGCERALRSVVVGRKNHYGSRSRRGTEVAALLYTLMECAKLAGVSAKAYLHAVTEYALKEPGAVLMPADYAATKSKS